MTEQVELRRTGRSAQIVLDRPARKNALTRDMLGQLAGIVDDLSRDDTTDVVVISGAGTDFCAGSDAGDITAMLALDPAGRAAAFEAGLPATIQPLMRGLLNLKQVLVASARGHAVGLGAAVILAADLTILSESAKLSLPQVKLGHTVDHGESWLLPRKVGLGRAMRIALLGDRLSALDAERFGAANLVVSDDDLERATDDLVQRLLGISTTSLRGTKSLLAGSLDRDLETQFAAEARTAATCAASQDFVDAITAQLGSLSTTAR